MKKLNIILVKKINKLNFKILNKNVLLVFLYNMLEDYWCRFFGYLFHHFLTIDIWKKSFKTCNTYEGTDDVFFLLLLSVKSQTVKVELFS